MQRKLVVILSVLAMTLALFPSTPSAAGAQSKCFPMRFAMPTIPATASRSSVSALPPAP